jgi:hypothetical protein
LRQSLAAGSILPGIEGRSKGEGSAPAVGFVAAGDSPAVGFVAAGDSSAVGFVAAGVSPGVGS